MPALICQPLHRKPRIRQPGPCPPKITRPSPIRTRPETQRLITITLETFQASQCPREQPSHYYRRYSSGPATGRCCAAVRESAGSVHLCTRTQVVCALRSGKPGGGESLRCARDAWSGAVRAAASQSCRRGRRCAPNKGSHAECCAEQSVRRHSRTTHRLRVRRRADAPVD